MVTGTIKRIVSDKGYGFIREEGGPNEYFFHRSTVDGDFADLQEGQKVSFEPTRGDKGLRAEDVRPA